MARIHALALTIAALSTLPALCPAAETDSPGRQALETFFDTDLLIDRYAASVGRKYNLTDEQQEYTRLLVRDRVNTFLGKHRDSVYDLIGSVIDARTGSELGAADVVDWGQRAQPIFREAKQMILEAGVEWQGVLNDEQLRIYESDLDLMQTNFERTEVLLDRMATGQMTVDEFRDPMRQLRDLQRPKQTPGVAVAERAIERRRAADAAERGVEPTQFTARHGSAVARVTTTAPSPRRAEPPREAYEDAWEKYVEAFIERYQLNADQAAKARLVLTVCKQQAASHMTRVRERLAALDEELAELPKDAPNTRKASLDKRRAELLAPIKRTFEQQLKPRLEKLPTRAQRQAAEAAEAPKER